MTIFNLSNWNYTRMVEAMAGGAPAWKYREPLKWWKYEDLVINPPENWQETLRTEPSLADVLRDARNDRKRYLQELYQTYHLSEDQSSRLLITLIGYNPLYGAYILEIGPYLSTGERHGPTHVVREAINKFYYGIIKKPIASEESMREILGRHIEDYVKEYGITLDPSDFGLKIKAPSEEYDVSSKTQSKELIAEVKNLDPLNPEAQDLYERAPLITSGSEIVVNNKGLLKTLKGLLGEWYDEIIQQKAVEQNKSIEQVEQDLLSDDNFMAQIYNVTYNKWLEARENGEATALGIIAPPKYKSSSVTHAAGQQKETKVTTSKDVINQLNFRKEILEYLKSGITNPEEIAKQLNAQPDRIKENKTRKYRYNYHIKQKNKAIEVGNNEEAARQNELARRMEPSIISSGEVESQISKLYGMSRSAKAKGMNITQALEELTQIVQHNMEANRKVDPNAPGQDSAKATWGYGDLRTAIDIASMTFSGQVSDVLTKTKLGESTIDALAIPQNFINYTSEDLATLKSGQPLPVKKTEEELKEEEENKQQEIPVATPTEIEKEIGKKKKKTKPELKTPPVKEKQPEPVTPPEVPVEPVTEPVNEDDDYSWVSTKRKDLLSNTIQHLIKIAEELDYDNKIEESEEVHRVIRKYIEGIL